MIITPDDLIGSLRQVAAPKYVVFGYESDNGNYLAAVAKINFNYKRELNAEQVADGQEVTEPGPRPWGSIIVGTPLIAHKDRFYLACWITQTILHTDADGVWLKVVSGYKDLKITGIRMLAITNVIFNVRGSDVSST